MLRNYLVWTIRRENKAFLNSFVKVRKNDCERRCKVVLKKQIALPGNLNDLNRINSYLIDSVQKFLISTRTILERTLAIYEVVTNDNEILSCSTTRPMGVDNISINMITWSCPFIVSYITHIINAYVSANYFTSHTNRVSDGYSNQLVLEQTKHFTYSA